MQNTSGRLFRNEEDQVSLRRRKRYPSHEEETQRSLNPRPPKVSVVLPTYNGSKHLAQSIQSILDQTLTDWELVIVDDCSSDETPIIIKAFTDPRIHYMRNGCNYKLPRSLNRGFSLCSGEYLTWTSDDNWYAPNALERMADVLDACPEFGLVCANRVLLDDNDDVITSQVLRPSVEMPERNCVQACFMYRREIPRTIGGYNPDALLVEDYEYWVRIHNRFRIGTIHEDLYYYRMRKGSLSDQYGEAHIRDLHNSVARTMSSRKRILQMRVYRSVVRWSTRGLTHRHGWILRPLRVLCTRLLKLYITLPKGVVVEPCQR